MSGVASRQMNRAKRTKRHDSKCAIQNKSKYTFTKGIRKHFRKHVVGFCFWVGGRRRISPNEYFKGRARDGPCQLHKQFSMEGFSVAEEDQVRVAEKELQWYPSCVIIPVPQLSSKSICHHYLSVHPLPILYLLQLMDSLPSLLHFGLSASHNLFNRGA